MIESTSPSDQPTTVASASSALPKPPVDVPALAVQPQRSLQTVAVLVLAVICMVSSVALWQRLGRIQSQLAKQNQESAAMSQEARVVARGAMDTSQQTAAKQALIEAKVQEIVVQKAQVDEMLQGLSRSTIENQVLDIEASLILAQQQAQLTGSVEPMLSALSRGQLRLARAPSPRLLPLMNAMRRDTDRLRSASVLDAPTVLIRLDELVRLADELPLVAAAPRLASRAVPTSIKEKVQGPNAPTTAAFGLAQQWWTEGWEGLKAQFTGLVRLRRIDNPDAVLLSPEQGFFVRENLKLKLLNARLGLLARQFSTARADLVQVRVTIEQYFDVRSRSGQAALATLEQVQAQLNAGSLPSIDESLNAVAAMAVRK
jgi:uroporphyrin-3 C-methyltransferase